METRRTLSIEKTTRATITNILSEGIEKIYRNEI